MPGDFTGDEIIFADHDQGSGCSGPAAIVEALLAELAWITDDAADCGSGHREKFVNALTTTSSS
jgi:hypothetical protein